MTSLRGIFTYTWILVSTLFVWTLPGCSGLESMPVSARAGDTVVLVAGWKQHFEREDLTITVTDASGMSTVYSPGDPAVRGVINLYPDPLSYMVVGTRVGLGDSNYNYGSTYGSIVTANNTQNDPDWWQTSVYIDLPASLSPGTATVAIQATGGETYGPIPVEIMPGQGSPAAFTADGLGPLSPTQMHALERAPFRTIRFSGSQTPFPAGIEVDLTHDPDQSAGGAGKPLAVNPRGEMKNLSWSDDGTTMKVLLTASGDGTWRDPYRETIYGLNYYKFYVTGGLTGVQVQNVRAFDTDGREIAGIVAAVE